MRGAVNLPPLMHEHHVAVAAQAGIARPFVARKDYEAAVLVVFGRRLRDATASIEPTGRDTFVLKLKDKFGLVLEALAKPSTFVAFMMPKRLAETPLGKAMAEQIGSGPFKFVASEFRMNVRVVYEKNTDYKPRAEPPSWASGGKVVKVDRVEWQSIPDALTAVNALQAGEIDYLEVPPFDMLPTLEADPKITVRIVNKVGFQIYGRMNFLYPPFDNLQIRRAALLALNQKDFLEAMVGNPKLYTICGAIFGCGTPLASELGTQTLTQGSGVAEAKKLLVKAGYDGTPVVLIAPTDAVTVKTQPAVAAQLLRDVGFKVDVQAMDAQTWIARGYSKKPPKEGGWDLLFSVFGVMDAWDPIGNLYLNSRGLKGGFRGWPDDPTMEGLLDAYARVATPAERKAIALQIQARALDQVTYIPVGQVAYPSAWRREWSGVVEFGSPSVFWNIERKP